MRKNLNRLATLALSGMMVMSMAVPAFAAPQVPTEVKIPFTKILHTDGNTYAPNTSFEFEVTNKTEAKITINNENFDNLQADAGAITIKNAVFSPDDQGLGTPDTGVGYDGEPAGAQMKAPTEIVAHVDKFNKGNGYYFFNLKEKATGYEGVRYSKAEYTIVVIKENATDANPTGLTVIVQRNDKLTDKASKVDTIQNNYGKHFPPETPDFPDPKKPTPENPKPDPDPNNDTTHDVTIRKRVKGGLGDKSKDFTFKVKVVPSNGGERYKVESVGNNVGANFINAGNEGLTFTVKNDQGIKIYGLTANDQVLVEESNGESYTMTVGTVANKDTYVTGLAATGFNAQFKVAKDKAEVDVINTKNPTTPTGIVMNVAPYAMMLAVAGGLGVVFMNRKKEEE